MRVESSTWTGASGWIGPVAERSPLQDAQLVLLFGGREVFERTDPVPSLRAAYPGAIIAGCTTSGEIRGSSVLDDSLVATAVHFDHTRVRAAACSLEGDATSEAVGSALATKLAGDGLAHVFVLSDGLHVNGSELVRGFTSRLPQGVAVTGGLAGDGTKFERTLVRLNGDSGPDRVLALGFYGERLRVGYASKGGWDAFGPTRRISRSKNNVLFELDGEPALAVYRRYLGEHAGGLPASGLLFPLSLGDSHRADGLVRTILGVDEATQSLTFAGDMPEGAEARLMKASFERLIDGAGGAAEASKGTLGVTPSLGILISCVGRRLIMRQRTEEELESVSHAFGPGPVYTGFYSYGEIAPFTANAPCELHNQTMTITTFAEV